mmetsp:Transcript_9036/g.23421  ORF Transcript_9036/g.23421 Transcript_9036/m.23421 type:complete len:692 (-) Transcript_9036:26-2101(-)
MEMPIPSRVMRFGMCRPGSSELAQFASTASASVRVSQGCGEVLLLGASDALDTQKLNLIPQLLQGPGGEVLLTNALLLLDRILGQIPLSVERGHGTGARRGDRLPVYVICNVTGSEDAGYRSPGGLVRRHDVVVRVHLHLPLHVPRIRIVADRHERRVDLQGRRLLAGIRGVREHQLAQRLHLLAALQRDGLADVLLDRRVPAHVDVPVRLHALLQDQAGAHDVAADQQVHFGADAREHQGLLHRRVTSADDSARLALEQVAVAGGAARHAVPAEVVFALGMKPSAVSPGGQDDRVGPDQAALVGHDLERRGRGVDGHDAVIPDLGEEAACLVLHDLDHLAAVLAGHAGVVLDVHALGQQLAAQRWRDDEGAQVGASCVDRRRHARGAASNDHHLLDGALGAVAVEAARVVCQPALLLVDALHGGILLSPLKLLLQLIEGGHLQVRLAGLLAAAVAAALRGLLLLLRLLPLALLRLRRLAVLLLQKASHGAPIVAVLRDDLVDALRCCLLRVMLLVEGLQSLACDLYIITLELLDKPLGPLTQGVLVGAGELMPLLPLHPKLEGRHGANSLRLGRLTVPVDVDLAEVGAPGELLGDLAEDRGDHVARTAVLTVVVDDDRSTVVLGLRQEVLELLVGVELLCRMCTSGPGQHRYSDAEKTSREERHLYSRRCAKIAKEPALARRAPRSLSRP